MATDRFPSAAELDLKARLEADDGGESVLSSRAMTVQPDPFGDDKYVGTDPIYQGRANKTEQPNNAKSGTEREAEEAFREVAESPQVEDESKVVKDFGMGGTALKAGPTTVDVPDVTIGASADVTHASDSTSSSDSGSGGEDPDQTDPAGAPSETDGGVQSPASPAPAPPTPTGDDKNKK